MNNRELAAMVILAVVLVFGMTRVDVRDAFVAVLRATRSWKIWVPFTIYLFFIAGSIWIFSRFGLWNRSMLAESGFWVIASGIPLLFAMPDSDRSPTFFRDRLRSVFELSAIFIFFVNLATFNLPWEIGLQLFLWTLVAVGVAAAKEPHYQPVRRYVSSAWMIVILFLVSFTIVRTISQFDSINKHQILLSFLSSLWLPLCTIVFLFLFSIVGSYEKAFLKFGMPRDSQRPKLADKLALITVVGPRLTILGAVKPYWGRKIMGVDSFRTKRLIAREFLNDRKSRADSEKQAERRLVDFAGISSDDGVERKLDRREFSETIEAMHWIYACQLGQYQKRDGTYNPELIGLLGKFTGLPDNHGISLEVSDDGQSWFAWRRTITGWVFGVGASGPPPDKWYFDGQDVPHEYPSTKDGWDHWSPASNARNWN